jgi:adenylate cyclase
VARWLPPILLRPLAGYFLLIAQPPWDAHWENHRAHFWLVFAVAVVNAALGLVIGEAARRRRDARVALVGLTLLTSAGFLGLHALATPGVLLSGKNTGFVVATPVGLALAAVFAAASGLDLSGARGAFVVRRERTLRLAVLLLLALWAGWSLASVPPLERPLPPSEATGPLVVFAIVGVTLYAFAAWRYVQLLRRRPSLLLAAVTSAFVLLAETLIAVAFARNWHATSWEWHLLMAAGFLLVAAAVRREYSRAGSVAAALGSLYLEQTIARVDSEYAQALAALAAESGGTADVAELARRTAERFGLDADQAVLLERAAAQIRDVDQLYRRAGVNTGPAIVGNVGTTEQRSFAAIGDTTNLAARLQAAAARRVRSSSAPARPRRSAPSCRSSRSGDST